MTKPIKIYDKVWFQEVDRANDNMGSYYFYTNAPEGDKGGRFLFFESEFLSLNITLKDIISKQEEKKV